MNDCIFCKIIKSEIPSTRIYEDEEILAFLDITPVNYGHTLIIPKEHFESLDGTPDETLSKLLPAAKRVSSALKKSGLAEGTNIGINNGPAAGQIVPHFHIHVMPRLKNDGHELWHGRKYDGDEAMKEIAGKIRKHL